MCRSSRSRAERARHLVALAALLAAALLPGCSTDEPARRDAPPRPQLRLVVAPEQNVFHQVERYEPLAAWLSGRTGVEVSVRVVPRYADLVGELEAGRAAGAFVGSMAYVVARERLGVVPVARPVGPDGTSTYHGLLLVRRDAGVRDLAGLRGRTFAFVDETTTAGYLFPRAAVRALGAAEPEAFFGRTYFAGTHEGAIRDVLERHADGAAVKNTVFLRLARTEPRLARELLVLARSPEVPENALVLHPAVPPEVQQALRSALLDAPRDPAATDALRKLGARGFVATDDAEYAYVREARRAALP